MGHREQQVDIPSLSPSNHFWYAIHVQAKFERVVSVVLRDKGYEEFLPLYRTKRQWSDRIKQAGLPLFPGYIFCRIDLNTRLLPIITTPGVLGIVGAGKRPIALSEQEIGAIQAVIRSGLPTIPWPGLNVGSRVLVERGPLSGLEGTVLDAEKKYRLIVSVHLLQRSVAVEIERDWVRPLPRHGVGSAAAVPLNYPLRDSARAL